MACSLRTANWAWQVVQVMENKAFSTVPHAMRGRLGLGTAGQPTDRPFYNSTTLRGMCHPVCWTVLAARRGEAGHGPTLGSS